MTSAQIYALFINPILMLAILGAFATLLMRQSKRDAMRILEAERTSAASVPRVHETRDTTPNREHAPAE